MASAAVKNEGTKIAVIYARYSSTAQTEQSIEGQLHDAHAYAAQEGYTVLREYIDRATTGKNVHGRPEFLRMVHDSASHQFGYLIVWKLDRFARNTYDAAVYKKKLRENGVKILSVMERLGDTAESRMMESIIDAMNEYYSEDLKEKVRRGCRESVAKGRWIAGIPPFGYRLDDDLHLQIDPEKAELVREIFRRYCEGEGARSIARDMDRRGVHTMRGTTFSEDSVRRIIEAPRYIGKADIGGHAVPCPAIVSEEVFELAKQIKKSKQHANLGRPSNLAASHEEYLLSGIAYCGICGAPMTGECGRSATSTMYYYYKCAAKKKNREACTKKTERKDGLEDLVVDITFNYILDPLRIDWLAGRVAEIYDQRFDDSRVEDLKRSIANCERDMNLIMDRILKPGTSEAAIARYEAKIEELTAVKEDLNADLSRQLLALGTRHTVDDVKKWLLHLSDLDRHAPETKRLIIGAFVYRVYVYDGEVVVYYNVSDSRIEAEVKNAPKLDPGPFGGVSGPEGTKKPHPDTLDGCSKDAASYEPSAGLFELYDGGYYIFPRGFIGIYYVRSRS